MRFVTRRRARRLVPGVAGMILLAAQLLLPAVTLAHEIAESRHEHRDPSHHHDAANCSICQTIASTCRGGVPPVVAAVPRPINAVTFLRPVAAIDVLATVASFDTRSSRGPPTV